MVNVISKIDSGHLWHDEPIEDVSVIPIDGLVAIQDGERVGCGDAGYARTVAMPNMSMLLPMDDCARRIPIVN